MHPLVAAESAAGDLTTCCSLRPRLRGLCNHRRLLGIGGGTIVSPLLLELGVHPLVAAATSSLMVLFSASTAALAFAFDHLLNITYALVYGFGASPLSP